MTGLFTNTTLSASALNDAINGYTTNAQTGTTYTFVLADAGKLVTASNASASTYTIPLNSGVAYATGTWIDVLNLGAGTVTLSPTGGVTLNGTTTLAQNARVRLTKTGTDTWYASAFGGGGLTLITTSTISAVSSASVNNCFTSGFENYSIVINCVGSAASQSMFLRLRVAGVDAATSYDYELLTADGATVSASRSSAATQYQISGSTSTQSGYAVDVYRPAIAAATQVSSRSAYTGSAAMLVLTSGAHTTATAYDGFSIYPASGTITGTLRVYGISN